MDSRWSTIKHDKAKADARKGKVLAVLAKELTDASKSTQDKKSKMTLGLAMLTHSL